MSTTVLGEAVERCRVSGYDMVTNEMVLEVIARRGYFNGTQLDVDSMLRRLDEFFNDIYGDGKKEELTIEQMRQSEDLFLALTIGCKAAATMKRNYVTVFDYVLALVQCDSNMIYASYILKSEIGKTGLGGIEFLKKWSCNEDIGCSFDTVSEKFSIRTGEALTDVISGNVEEDKSKESEELGINSDFESMIIDLREKSKKSSNKLIGRKDIIEKVFDTLCKMDTGNVVLVGEPGVGKTEIVMEVARLIENNSKRVPKKLRDSFVFELDMTCVLANSIYRGQLESNLRETFSYIRELCEKNNKTAILHIDSIDKSVNNSSPHNTGMSLVEVLKRYIEFGEFKVIGATTFDEYRKSIDGKKDFEQLFSCVEVPEPSVAEAKRIVSSGIQRYEEYHNVEYKKDAIEKVVELSNKYINEKRLPSKAFHILDECGAYVNTHHKECKERVVEARLAEKILSRYCRIPVESIEESEEEVIKNIGRRMKEDIIGQDTAIDEIERSIKISKAGLNDSNKPIASLLFVGPTGTGKTETARSLAKNLGVKLVKFDMSEFSDSTSVTKFIGSSAGYVGYEDGSLLIKEIRNNPNCVLLLDEIEKADSKVFDTLLQVMDDATLTDSRGISASFRDVVIIMTSNAGASKIGRGKLGFGSQGDTGIIGEENIDNELKNIFKPEFRNRLSKVIKFRSINDDMALMIAKKLMSELESKVVERGRKLVVEDRVYLKIAEFGTSIETGAREMQRYINTNIKDSISDKILFSRSKKITVGVGREDNIVVK